MTEKPTTQFIVRDKHGKSYGPFDSQQDVAQFARRKWPDQEQDSERAGVGWDVEVLWPPESDGRG